MYDRVLDPKTGSALDRLSAWASKRDFYLAGGTGCALHLGHRMSHDLDFFALPEFDPSRLWTELRNLGECAPDYSDAGTWVGQFDGTKVSFFHYPYPLLREPVPFGEASIASLEDIGCMKIEAIAGRGRKRDFIDLYFLLIETGFDLNALWALFQRKYPAEHRNLIHVLKSLVYFIDADADPDPIMLVEYSWPDMKRALAERVKTIAI
jgi:hypothetical protein